jgi:hypothetical protein
MDMLETISEQRLHGGLQGVYWFIASFIDDHLRHHAGPLGVA